MKLLSKLTGGSDFTTNILKLLTSTVFASIINIVALPIITRLYSTEDLGIFQLALSVIMILAVTSTLKYELAVVLPKEEDDARHIILLCLITLLLITVALIIIFPYLEAPLLNLLNAEAVKGFAFPIILGVFFTGLLQIARYILIRKKLFGDLAKNKVYQAASNQITVISWGAVQANFLGLIIGYLAGAIVPVLVIFYKGLIHFQNISLQKIKELGLRFKKFPLVNTWMVFLNTFSLELPVFMLSNFFNPAVIGLYMLANRLSVIPINLLGTSIAQVYYQAASESFNENPAELMKIYKKTIKKLSLLGLIPLGIIIVFAPLLVGVIYGDEWTLSGDYMQIIAIAIYFRFINSPISTTFSIINKQEIGLILTIIFLAIRFTAMYVFRYTPESMLWALAISTALFYITFNYMIYLQIRKLTENE